MNTNNKKPKNLLLLPSVLLPAALGFLIEANSIVNTVLDGNEVDPSRIADLFFGVPISLITAYLRNWEDDEGTLYTPGFLPGANKEDCIENMRGAPQITTAVTEPTFDDIPESQIWQNNFSGVDPNINEEYFDNVT